MKFTANRLLLYEAAKTVLKTVRQNKEIPEISGILIEADAESGILTLTGTDIRTHIQRRLRQEHIEESGSMIVMPIFSDMLRLLDGEFVELETGKGHAVLRAGTCNYAIPYLEAKSFPKLQIPFPEDTIQIKGINSLIKRTVFATDDNVTDYNKATYSYVKLSFKSGITQAEATDGSCVAVATSPHCADGDLEITMHEKALNILYGIVKPDEALYAGIVGKHAVLMKEDMFFSTMLFTAKYLEASKLLDGIQIIYKATVDVKQFYEQIVSLTTILGTEDDKCIDLQIDADRVCVQVKTARCTSSAHIQAKVIAPTTEETFHYQPRLWIECLRRLAGPVQIGIDRRGFALMEANGCRYCICPRGPARIAKKDDHSEEKSQKPQKNKTNAVIAA